MLRCPRICDAPAVCGVITTFGICQSGWSGGSGSIGVTSQSYLRIPLGVMFGIVFFGETLLTSTWIGLVFVLIGVVAMTWPARAARPLEPPPA